MTNDDDVPAYAFPADRPAIIARLERTHARLAHTVGPIAKAIDERIFDGVPPKIVSWTAVIAAIDERAGVPMEDRAARKAVLDRCDVELVPTDVDVYTTRELVDVTVFLAAHAAKQLGTPGWENESPRLARKVFLHVSLVLAHLVFAAQVAGEQLLVAGVAEGLGIDPIPFPEMLTPRDSA